MPLNLLMNPSLTLRRSQHSWLKQEWSLANIRQRQRLQLNKKLDQANNLIGTEITFFKSHLYSSKLSGYLACTLAPFRTRKSFANSFKCSTVRRSMVSLTKPFEYRLTSPSKTLVSSPLSIVMWKLDVTWKNVRSASGWKKFPTRFGKFTQKSECESKDASSSTKTRMTSCSGSLRMSKCLRRTNNGWTRT